MATAALPSLRMQGRFGRYQRGAIVYDRSQLIGWSNAIDETDLQGRRGIDHLACEKHFHRALAVDDTCQRDRRCGAEQPNVDAIDGESGPVGGKGKVARSDHWQPAAAATPSTSAMVGLGKAAIDCISRAQTAKTRWKYSSPRSASRRCKVICLRSCPAEKSFPAAAITITRTAVSVGDRVQLGLERLHEVKGECVGRRVLQQ